MEACLDLFFTAEAIRVVALVLPTSWTAAECDIVSYVDVDWSGQLMHRCHILPIVSVRFITD